MTTTEPARKLRDLTPAALVRSIQSETVGLGQHLDQPHDDERLDALIRSAYVGSIGARAVTLEGKMREHVQALRDLADGIDRKAAHDEEWAAELTVPAVASTRQALETRARAYRQCARMIRDLAPATELPCDGCFAEPGDPCRPSCLSTTR